MFLITSGYKKTWIKDKKILFAGEWCKSFDDSSEEKLLDSETFEYHWNDRHKLKSDIDSLNKIYEKYLELLSYQLNSIHNVNGSIRYWRMIVGPWLRDFIEVLYDYHQVIMGIEKSNLIDNTIIIDALWQEQIPQDIASFQASYSQSWYLHFIISEIIKYSSKIPYEVVNLKHPKVINNYEDTGTQSINYKFKRFIKYFLCLIYSSKIIADKKKKVIFIASYFKNLDLNIIQKKLHQLPFLYLFDPKPKKKRCNESLRKSIRIQNGSNEFEKLLVFLIPKQIPIAYVENFQSYNRLSKFLFPSKPSVIFTANSYYFNECFKVWVANKMEQGAKLFIAQHGGFGTALWNQTEEHQIKICDRFFSWGWERANEKKIKAMPANKLNDIKKKISSKKNGKILCIVNSDIINYLHTQVPHPTNSNFKKYASNIIKLNDNLDVKVSSLMSYRLYHTDYNRDTYGLKTEFIKNGLSQSLDTNKHFYDSLNLSRIVIITYHPNATALETLSANFPTLLFWDPRVFEINEYANKYFLALKDAKVFHTSSESLKKHLEKVYLDIDRWWFSEEVQNAVNQFCNEFALSSDDFLESWANEISLSIN